MNVENLINYGKKYIHKDLIFILLSDLLNINYLNIYNHLDDKVNDELITKYKNQIEKIKNGIPIQYVLGHVNFYGLPLQINENVLIPRFETEMLVEKTLEYIDKYFLQQKIDVIDLGTGSGAIGLTLKKYNENVNITLNDISSKALDVAKNNAILNQIEAKFIKSDFLKNNKEKYDVVISNPPYIKYEEKIEKIVYENEPHLALYASNNGLECYEKILKEVNNNIKEKYLIAFEIGMTQKKDLKLLQEKYLKEANFICKKDLNNKERYIFITNCE